MNLQRGSLTQSTAILIAGVMISFSILLSSGVIKIKGLTAYKPLATSAPLAQNDNNPSPAPLVNPQQAQPAGPVKVELADAPVLGSKGATVTVVEFSDYECPFCKRHYDQVYPELKKNYIDTNKAKLVFRNLPLPFHQNAHKEAEAALCVRDQGGDSAYFKYHDLMFTKTTSNGTGLALDQLPKLATEIGVDGSKVQSCLDSAKYKDYVDKDLAYASTIGATGTPTFFIGKSADKEIEGKIIVGAQPYSVFQAAIDALLK